MIDGDNGNLSSDPFLITRVESVAGETAGKEFPESRGDFDESRNREPRDTSTRNRYSRRRDRLGRIVDIRLTKIFDRPIIIGLLIRISLDHGFRAYDTRVQM